MHGFARPLYSIRNTGPAHVLLPLLLCHHGITRAGQDAHMNENLALLVYYYNDLCFALDVCVSNCFSLDPANRPVIQNLCFR